MSPTEPEERERSDRHDDDLGECECKRRRPEHPQRRQQREQRVDVDGEANDLLTRWPIRHLERASLRRAPDRLHHVPEVEAAKSEVQVRAANNREHEDRPNAHRTPDRERPRAVADRSG